MRWLVQPLVAVSATTWTSRRQNYVDTSKETGVGIQRHGDQIQLVMPGNITFETASSNLAGSFYQVLDAVAVVLKKYDKTALNVDGHTDSQGSDNYNLELSQDRALAVSNYLASQGITHERINSSGYGENSPIADNGTAAGRAANRRVELWIQPLT